MGSRLAQELGRSNIKDIEYMYGGRAGIHGLQSSADKPVLAVAYGLKTAYRENFMRVMVYEYATEAEAVQVRRAVLAQEGTPGWHTVYFQKGNTVCTLDWSYGERTTDRGRAALSARLRHAERGLRGIYTQELKSGEASSAYNPPAGLGRGGLTVIR